MLLFNWFVCYGNRVGTVQLFRRVYPPVCQAVESICWLCEEIHRSLFYWGSEAGIQQSCWESCGFCSSNVHGHNLPNRWEQQTKLLILLDYMDPESGGMKFFQNVSNYLPINMVSYPRRLGSSSIPPKFMMPLNESWIWVGRILTSWKYFDILILKYMIIAFQKLYLLLYYCFLSYMWSN